LSKELTRRALNRQKKKDKYNEENADKEALNKSIFLQKLLIFFSLNKPNYELSGSAVEVHAD
jgi:hypothetical protein